MQTLTLVETGLAILAAMVANGSPVIVGRGTPLDAGKRFIDGRRVLGDGKTVEGTIVAIFYGLTIAITCGVALKDPKLVVAGASAVLGAVLGDIIASFVKRRLGLPRGSPVPIMDQLDFYLGSILLLLAAGFIPHPVVAAAFAPLIYVLHRLTNMAAYKLGIKDVPW